MPDNIREILEELLTNQNNRENYYSVIGRAINVNTTERTCELQSIESDSNKAGIRLQATIGISEGFVIIPKENSFIIVTFTDVRNGFVSLTSEIEEILIDTDLVQFNGGDNGGLININDLVTQMNTIENDLNSLKSALSGWIPVPNDGGAALKVALSTFISGTLTPTVKGDMEDENVKH